MASLTIQNVSHSYNSVKAVDNVSLEIEEGEFVSLLGPSGCGKTTLLRCVAGFEAIDKGEIYFDSQCMSGPNQFIPPEHRRVGMVFQTYALWPHMSVAQNVGYPLRVQRTSIVELHRQVHAALEQVGMSSYAKRRPAELSGGQRQRVALARCLIMKPRLVLLDEPLANLDVHLRESMQEEFRTLHANSGTTMIYVTHDQSEAMALSDRIAVMNEGRIEQIATPQTLFNEPATEMVARFIGRGVVVSGMIERKSESGKVEVTILGTRVCARASRMNTGPTKFCLRAEWLELAQQGAKDCVPAKVINSVYRGGYTTIQLCPLNTESTSPITVQITGSTPANGEQVQLKIKDLWKIGT